MKNQIKQMNKHDWIIILFSMLIATATANAQDTVYIANSGSNVTITYKGSVKSVPRSLISASKTVSPILPTQVAIFNGASQVESWTFNYYRFKVNETAITNVDSFVPAVNNLNTAMIKSFKLLKDIQVVSALPSNPDPTVTYLVGNQSSINITGLNGNNDQMYNIEVVSLNPNTNDSQIMRFNNISTNVYDIRRATLGDSYSGTSVNAQSSMTFNISTGTNSLEQTSIIVHASTGKNRTMMAHAMRGGTNGITINNQYMTTGIWRDNSSNITSIQFGYASISNGYGVGTRIRVFSLQQ
jgi:hypothetical protein